MSNIRERILDAVTVMSEKVWYLIMTTFALANVDEVEPDPNEKEIMLTYRSGAPDYQAAISQEDLIKELVL